jgi:hypothetical protein
MGLSSSYQSLSEITKLVYKAMPVDGVTAILPGTGGKLTSKLKVFCEGKK